MSYSSIYQCASDPAMAYRVTACVASERGGDTSEATQTLIWQVSTASDVAAAYEAALVGENPDPGGDPAVVTDQMILSHVQANIGQLEPR